ncbi:zinc transporter ZIP10 [Toxorhynchites rutilus septentrionalis]|uniref:zinc transporter ZIP10 n=1 Tax=Toxorhynchites rutilus septentrionalis TaxID=329112 RepID=UPI00247AE48A|nr:zinc transporter ZIP10 [Toxorhynchites rutilus septentrionalis]
MTMRRHFLEALLLVACVHAAIAGDDPLQTPASGGSSGENKFLKYLFNKYGSRGVISFEGLEHLMHSLGLGGLDFVPSHTLDEHRPEGFKTQDIVIPFTASDADGEDKVTVSFTTIDENPDDSPEPPKYTTLTSTDLPASTVGSTQQPSRSTESHRNHGPHQDAIVTSSDQIRNLNEVLGSDKNDNNTISSHSTDDETEDDNTGNKWHNEIWQEIIFKEIHDPHHRHLRRDERRKSCLSPMSIVHLILEEPTNPDQVLRQNFNYNLDPLNRYRRALSDQHGYDELEQEVEEIMAARIKITPNTFKDLCPALLAQIDQRACNQKFQLGDQPHVEKKLFSYAWVYATFCVLIISICGLAGVAVVPLVKSVAYDEILRFLVALAVGTLCGDALMHLLPHALISHVDHDAAIDSSNDGKHSHEDEPVWLCFCAFLSALSMYTLETVLPMLRSDEDGAHHHGHSHGRAKVAPAPEPEFDQKRRNTNIIDDIEMDLQENKRKELNTMLEKKKLQSKPMSPLAFMVVVGDGLHNVTDGLAIGAAFAADPVTGMATSLAILCHELPHELGDFALLLQTGVSIKRAMMLNVVSSILSFIGMFAGLLVTGLHESVVRWIYAGTAGTFLYIALADLVPEMNRDLGDSGPDMKPSRKLRIIFTQISGMFIGGMIMVAIALNEDHLRLLFE